jgi:2-keto-4-pentenoate hydratase/2-oxohepta-3-ene-1,7-dioic acid hydratase in catechol pathway
MKLVTYQTPTGPTLGALHNDQVIDLAAAHQMENGSRPFPATMLALLEAGEAGLTMARAALDYALAHDTLQQPQDSVSLLPPVTRPGKIICLGRNYAAHAREGGAEPLEFPILFYKPTSALLPHGGTIVIPPVTEKPDFEAELAVIMGRACKQVSVEAALDYVAGYSAANDVSARDLQRRTHQWAAGKMPDTFCPLGPALVTADEVPEPGNLTIRAILNGQEMQHSNTSMMIFDVPFIISYISQIATLEPGDIILTGTPEGVGNARIPPVYLQAGDTISIEIEKVGLLTNGVASSS